MKPIDWRTVAVATAPGAARLADLRAGVEGEAALCLFPEAQHDDGLVKQLADGKKVRVFKSNGEVVDA